MADKSKIEWTDATWNPIRGTKGKWHCTKVSEGCKNCYAERMNVRFGGPAYTVGADTLRLDEHVLEQPLRWRKPRMIFVCSMTDLFHEDVPFEHVLDVWRIMAKAPEHIFQILTKRAQRMNEYFSWLSRNVACPEWADVLPNVWLGVTAENQKAANERIPWLQKTPARVRWVSAEPLIGPLSLIEAVEPNEELYDQVDLEDTGGEPDEFIEECELECDWINYGNDLVLNPEYTDWVAWRKRRVKGLTFGEEIDWVVVGGESGPKARPMNPRWLRNLKYECKTYDVPFFFKQWGEYAPCDNFEICPPTVDYRFPDGYGLHRVGKVAAGRLLDGVEWDEWPK